MKSKKTDCRMAVLEELCTGEALSLGDLLRRLRPTWSQSMIQRQLELLVAAEKIVQSTRVDFVRGGRLKVVTYVMAGSKQ